ncbi:MAG: type III-A CRISPR-associated protein Csm2 [Chloroflexota bacterium]
MSKGNWEASFPQPTDQELKIIITNKDGAETLVKCAEEIGKTLARQLTTSQIRAIFGEVRRIEGDWRPIAAGEQEKSTERAKRASRNLILLKPKMKYRAEKERSAAVRNLVSVLSPAIDLVQNDEQNFTRFVEFFEAILAYHKAYGGN